MEGVVEVDALVVDAASRRASAPSRRRSGRRRSAPPAQPRPARADAPSGTPFHLPMQLQPSTQSWRVICVRDGMARRSASENSAGVSTRPSTFSRQSAKPFSRQRAIVRHRPASSCRWRGIRRQVGLGRTPAPGRSSRAARAARRASGARALDRMSRNHGACGQLVAAAEHAAPRRRSRRRAESRAGSVACIPRHARFLPRRSGSGR